ncbi:CapA family protein [Actinomadura sp. LD22]|uniref:CapA family protein n=1 Tax=Actinomadura physcomitrii TaxID=2650748 RepID=A0A6I4MMJ2_9ACTN|nr:CapA family protein [Actinomadura physcomitrii]MWA04781.1 CapA family protein [Actinomadura physcomitrii]
MSGGTTIAIAGECLASRPFAQVADPGLLEIRDLLHASDVTYAHLEMNFGAFCEMHAGRGDTFGSYMLADPQVARDLRWLGVDVLSMANNHSLDFGQHGLLSTLDNCRAAGLVCAGTGRDLDEARAPAYTETPGGRVALVSTASGNKAQEWAGHPKGTMVGRPGINPLRVSMEYQVDARAAAALRGAAHGLGILRTSTQSGPGKTGPVLDPDQFQLLLPGGQSAAGEFVFREGSDHRIDTRCHPGDLEANLRSIRAAAAQADVVLVAHHFNLSEGPRGDHPPAFVREFAHRAIDEGADIYLGHGWHKTLGIEIYRGKPIFYGLGNFFAQSAFIEHVPADGYETWRHDPDLLPSQTPELWPLHPGLEPHRRTWWSSAVISVRLEAGRVESIRLHPVELGRDVSPEAPITRRTGGSKEHPLTEGRPRPGTGDNATRVLERLQGLSAELGTHLEIDDGVGSIHLGARSAVGIGD